LERHLGEALSAAEDVDVTVVEAGHDALAAEVDRANDAEPADRFLVAPKLLGGPDGEDAAGGEGQRRGFGLGRVAGPDAAVDEERLDRPGRAGDVGPERRAGECENDEGGDETAHRWCLPGTATPGRVARRAAGARDPGVSTPGYWRAPLRG